MQSAVGAEGSIMGVDNAGLLHLPFAESTVHSVSNTVKPEHTDYSESQTKVGSLNLESTIIQLRKAKSPDIQHI